MPRGASAATAYHKLFRGAAHLVPSYPAPPAECKAGSEDRPSPFLSSETPRTGKYAHFWALFGLSLATLHARINELWEVAIRDPKSVVVPSDLAPAL